jgi:hypothetical protein
MDERAPRMALATLDEALSLLPPEKGYRQVVAGTGQLAP